MRRIFASVLVLAFATSCFSPKPKEPEKVVPKFCIPDSLMNQIKMDTIELKPVFNELNLIGKVTFDQEKVVRIYPLVSGIVVDVKVTLGAHVEKGQILAVIKSSEMAGAENDLVTARSNLAVADKNFAAASDMNKSGILSDKEFTTAQKELDKARSEFERATTVLSIYGTNTQKDYLVKAPISGFIVEKFINTSMQIRSDNSTNLFTISDLKNVWVLANVYESDIAEVKENDPVEITTISYPDVKYPGKIDKIYNMLDPENKTMKVQIKLNNDDYKLKPEMFAKVIVHQVSNTKMLAIPSDALIFDRNLNWVLIYKDKCNIQTRKIDKVLQNSKYTYVNNGVQAGERVITNRQLLIYSAINQ